MQGGVDGTSRVTRGRFSHHPHAYDQWPTSIEGRVPYVTVAEPRPYGWCIKLWDITSLGSVQVVGFFDVAARLSVGDGPIAALVGGSSL